MIIKKKLTLVSTFLILVSLSGAAAFTEEGNSERGFLFGLSLGWGAAGYNEPLQSWIDTINTLPGINHLGIGLGMEAGYSIYPNTYIVGGIEGIGDRYSDSYGNYEQYNTYFYYGGVKVYPFHTGLALTGKIGAGRLVADISGYGSEATGMGLALGGTIAYDFNRKSRGFGFETGLSLNYLGNMDFYGESISASQLFIFGKLLWK